MQVVILCGGSGTRLREQTEFIPKPLIPIGGKPMIYHIMRHYAMYGFKSFILALGYKQEAFKEYFAHYNEINSDTLVDSHGVNPMEISDFDAILSDTGENTLKGGRLKRIEAYIRDDIFMITYGDAVSDVDLFELLDFHNKHGRMVTLTGVNPAPRFGEIIHQDGTIHCFKEKPKNSTLINGGFMVMNKDIFNYLDRNSDLEIGPFEILAEEKELMVYHHTGMWQCLDNLNDMVKLQNMWDEKSQQFRRENV